jgi:hypothetical protein
MTPIPLEEPTKKDNEKQFLAEQLMEMSELEEVHSGDDDFKKWKEQQAEPDLIHKRINNINTFHVYENDVYLAGVDEYGKDFQICFDAYNFLEWIDKDQIEYIKEQTIKYIKTK